MWIIAADPGNSSGGLAMLRHDGVARFMPFWRKGEDKTLAMQPRCVEAIQELSGPRFGFVEAIPGSFSTFRERDDPTKPRNTSAKLTVQYGVIQGVYLASGIPYRRVMPTSWMTALGCKTGGVKKISSDRARELIQPKIDFRITEKNADALLIAYFGWRIVTGLSVVQSWGKGQAVWKDVQTFWGDFMPSGHG